MSASWKVMFLCFTSISLAKPRFSKIKHVVLLYKEIGQYDLLDVLSSPPVPILVIYLSAASSHFLLHTSKMSLTFL